MLLEEQKQTWPQLATGYVSLDSVRQREVICRGYSVWLQFNAGRIISTGAKVDARSIRERRCFLCVENLPAQQKGILYNDEFLVLCNPAPIFRGHFTVSHVNHIPQEFDPFVASFLSLARDMSPAYSLFYNGPKCGASAPDHVHFQASPAGSIPVEHDAVDSKRRVPRRNLGAVAISSLSGYGREVILLESKDETALKAALLGLTRSLRVVLKTQDEPMMNVLVSFGDGAWRVIVFPRSKHRPTAYFREGDDQILISPAAVDIGGLIITPLERDFNRVDAKTVEGMFEEVTIPGTVTDEVVKNLAV